MEIRKSLLTPRGVKPWHSCPGWGRGGWKSLEAFWGCAEAGERWPWHCWAGGWTSGGFSCLNDSVVLCFCGGNNQMVDVLSSRTVTVPSCSPLLMFSVLLLPCRPRSSDQKLNPVAVGASGRCQSHLQVPGEGCMDRGGFDSSLQASSRAAILRINPISAPSQWILCQLSVLPADPLAQRLGALLPLQFHCEIPIFSSTAAALLLPRAGLGVPGQPELGPGSLQLLCDPSAPWGDSRGQE